MIPIDLIIPMAEESKPFAEAGFSRPKPMLRLGGRPFFWWVAESVRRGFDVRQMVFVVGRAQVERFRIDRALSSYYPAADIVVLDGPAPNGLAAAAAGAAVLADTRWLMISHCGHAFDATPAGRALAVIATEADAFVCYAAAERGANGEASDAARVLPGTFGWRDRWSFLAYANTADSSSDISHLQRTVARHGKVVRGLPLDQHVSFATPEEYDEAPASIGRLPFLQHEAVLHG